MPKQPTWIDKVNFIRMYVTQGCNFPLWVYVEHGGKAAGNMILTLLSFGMDDIIRGYFRPKGVRSGRHGRKRRGKGRAKNLIPEVGEMIGKNLPGADDVQSRKFSQGYRTLWMVDGQIQRGLYYWLIVSVVTDFAYDWMSGILKDDRSYCPWTGRFSRWHEDEAVVPISGWQSMSAANLNYEEGGAQTGPLSGTITSGDWMCVLAMDIEHSNIGTNPSNVQIRVRKSGTDEYDYSPVITVQPGGSAQLVVNSFLLKGQSGAWEARAQGAFVFATRTEVVGIQMRQ